MTRLLFRDLHFSTVLSCLYWDSALLFLHVDSFFVILLSQLDVIFETSQNNGHDRHYLITELVAMAQRVWQPVLAAFQLKKQKILLPCCCYTLISLTGLIQMYLSICC